MIKQKFHLKIKSLCPIFVQNIIQYISIKKKHNVLDVPSLLEHLDSWVSYSNLHGPERPDKLSEGTSSGFGDKRWFE